MKGQTASSSYKPAKLSNGARVMVPPHISPGTRIVRADRGRQLRRARERLSNAGNEGGAGGLELVEVRDHPVRAELGTGTSV